MALLGLVILLPGWGLATYSIDVPKYEYDYWADWTVTSVTVHPYGGIGMALVLTGLITLLLGLASSSWWWLCPLYFGIIGGLIGYVGVKDEHEDMAMGLLIVGIIWTIILVIIVIATI